jgi:hypothetical protein
VAARWPINPAIYDDDASGAEAQSLWQREFDDALRVGDLWWVATGEDYVFELHGKCPRCGHKIHPKTVYFEYVMGFTEEERRRPTVTNFVCNCDKVHTGQPQDHAGCGWALLLTVTLDWPNEVRQ